MNRLAKSVTGLGLALLLVTACTAPQASTDEHSQMDHNQMETSDAPFDAQFIDGMIVHHQGAIDMSEQVLAEGEHPELLSLAEEIISAQQAEIKQMQSWRADWYPDQPVTESDMEMGDMEISDDASLPFDQRFLTAMISHHQGAIDMAKAAQEQAEHAEIKTLADTIIETQQAEIDQMKTWLQKWFGVTVS